MTITDYFNALQAGEVVTERESIDGNRALWEGFQSDRHPELAKAIKIIKRWYTERINRGGGLIIAGHHGCGKSHLARAIYQLYGWKAIFWEELNLVKAIQAGFNGGGRSEESIFTEARRAELLIFDDLGAYETDNIGWVQNIYRGLFDGRKEAGRGFLITTNLSLKAAGGQKSEFEEWVGARNFSRIMGGLEFKEYYISLFNVPDYRLKNF